MKEFPVFPHAPITEALLDIRADLPKEVNLERLETFYNNIKERFFEKHERVSFQTGFKFSPEGPLSLPTSSMPDGYIFKSPNENKIVQVRLDGFTFNKLKPYENWKIFCLEAHEHWDHYLQLTSPIKITRIALRYINRIEIPLPIKDFKEYILTFPKIAPKLPKALNHFFMQLVIPNTDIQATAIITQTIETPMKNRLPLILDIDVFRETSYNINNKDEMWDEFQKLRKFKNEIFFKNITKKTEELFK